MAANSIIVSVANQKGGVGKTTTTLTLAAALASRGRKILILDTDPQGHIAIGLGLEKSPDLYRLIVDDEPIVKIAQQARENLWIIASDKRTEKAKRYLVSMDYREHAVTNALAYAPFDMILIDMAPSLDVLHVAALVASDWLIIPTRLDHLAIDGVNEVLKTYAEINHNGGNIQGFSVLPTFYDRTTNETQTQLAALVGAFPENILPPIPADVRAREAAAYGKSLWEYAPHCPALMGYQNGAGHVGGYAQVLERLCDVWSIHK